MNQGKILQFYQTKKKKKKGFSKDCEKSAVFVPRWRLGSVCLEHCVERDSEALYHSSKGKKAPMD